MIIRHSIRRRCNNHLDLDKRFDTDINEDGVDLAYGKFRRMKEDGYIFNRIITSPFLRCRQTAEIAGKIFNCPIEIMTELHEILERDRYKMISMMRP